MYSSSPTSTAVKMKWLVFVFSAVGFFFKETQAKSGIIVTNL